jgi:hypothetical protein
MVNNGNGIIGTFVFRNEGDGCLNVKYMNEHENIPYGETCVLQHRNPGHRGFPGDYSTVWFEQTNRTVVANLSIQNNIAGNTNTFDLKWTIAGATTPIFTGIGMIYGELLVGAYWGVNG